MPPAEYPASPAPTRHRVVKSCVKFLVKAAAAVAKLHTIAMMAMAFFLLQRSISAPIGKVKTRIDQKTADTIMPHWASVKPQSLFRNGKRATMTNLSI